MSTGTAEYKKGLILEGGAMRGMFTCGVLDVFMENNISFDGAVGISAGAVFGCNIKSRQIGRALRYNQKYSRDPRYCSIRSLLRTGDLYGAQFCYDELPNRLDPFDQKTYINNPMEFYVGATDVKTGKALYHLCRDMGENDMLWMRASASMPIASRTVRVDGHELLDGGIADAVPFAFMEQQGYNRNVIVLTQPSGYMKQPAAMLPFKLALRHYPAVVGAMSVRHEMYNRQMREIREREQNGTSLVIRPPESLGIGRTEKDPEELGRVYRIGRKEAEKKLPELLSFLKETGTPQVKEDAP